MLVVVEGGRGRHALLVASDAGRTGDTVAFHVGGALMVLFSTTASFHRLGAGLRVQQIDFVLERNEIRVLARHGQQQPSRTQALMSQANIWMHGRA